MQQLADDLTHLRAVKDAYKHEEACSAVEYYRFTVRQADAQALWKYVMGFSSDLLSLKNSDVQGLYDEVAALSANIAYNSY